MRCVKQLNNQQVSLSLRWASGEWVFYKQMQASCLFIKPRSSKCLKILSVKIKLEFFSRAWKDCALSGVSSVESLRSAIDLYQQEICLKQMPTTAIRFLNKKFPSSLNGLHHYERQRQKNINQVVFRFIFNMPSFRCNKIVRNLYLFLTKVAV